ncbi:MAG: acetate--CoA ligase [Nitrososphaerota archaeon]|nr:acetate--CoA ligase [Candidatus Bathyarchaeota archaeon]MDW8048065.1 acetate--CoA ligase [Nitrososphaerota archaeon]
MSREPIKWIVEDPKKKNVFWPSEEMKKRAWVSDPSIYEEAAKDPVGFWAKLAKDGITWFKEWTETYRRVPPSYKWFIGGKLNICYNAVDRHVETWRRNKAAIIWEPEPTDERTRILTYYDLYREVNKFANVLKKLGVKKGDRVGIYLPMIPEVQIAMLACARIGAVHSVVFSAFSGASLRDRMIDAGAKVLVTADGYYRRGKPVNLKENADAGVEGTSIEKVVVVKRLGSEVKMVEGRDYWWHELMKDAEAYCEPEVMDSEDMLFILYTSGTTGKPKGIEHHVGGYTVQAYWTTKWDFDLHDDDVFFCTADIGWITGHTYNCYGPLMNGATFVLYEGAPDYPAPDRWWEIVEKYGVTVFYTAPTAIRMLMRFGDEWVKKHNLSSLRILATVGEPINEEAWLWYLNVVGGGRCPIIDTWWQTETGATLINSLPGIGPFIPTVAGRPFPGTRFAVLTEEGKPTGIGEGGFLVQMDPFSPGMFRTIYKDPQRFKEQYFGPYGENYYFTGDGAYIYDSMGNIRITGRVDDVMKVAGHRLSTAEVENAIALHPAVVECAVVAAPHDIKGEVPVAFVTLKPGYNPTPELEAELKKQVDKAIGPTARPERVIIVDDLPKTRSGKIMRRILKALTSNQPIGDISTLMNPESVEALKQKVGYKGSP